MEAMIQLDAGNDRNGNPRRAYVLLETGQDGTYVRAAWDEGYAGRDAVPDDLRSLAWGAPTFRVLPGEYRETLRRHGILDADTVGRAGQDPTLRTAPPEAAYGWTAALLEQYVD